MAADLRPRDCTAHPPAVTGAEFFAVTNGPGSIRVTAGEEPSPDAVIWSDPAALRAVIFGDHALPDALASGALRIDGNVGAAVVLLTS